MTNSKNSILIRGAISFDKRPQSFVQDTIPMIRDWFSGQLVVSTWKGQEQYLEGLSKYIDKLVVQDDPGLGFIQSYNRQLMSYETGLKECEGEMILVSRADFQFKNDVFSCCQRKPTNCGTHMKVFDERVIVGNMMTVPPHRAEPSVSHFRVSDWIQIGTKKDLGKWCGVLEKSKELYTQASGLSDITTTEYRTETYGSEQVWFISMLNKFADSNLNLQNYASYEPHHAWSALVNNFVILNTRSTLGAYNLNWQSQPEFHPWYITEDEFYEANRQLNGGSHD